MLRISSLLRSSPRIGVARLHTSSVNRYETNPYLKADALFLQNTLAATKTEKYSEADRAAHMKFASGYSTHLDSHMLDAQGIKSEHILRNASVATLYEHACEFEKGSVIASSGALIAKSGAKTGRSPLDKRVVDEPSSSKDVWWGPVNKKLTEESFMVNRERAIDFLSVADRLYVIDAFAGADPKHRIKVRVITTRAYHALFMWNMLVRPTAAELQNFGKPDYTIYNAGEFPCNRHTAGMTSGTSVALHFARGEVVILGTQYAGEMKKGVFTIMNYLMPKQGYLSMHASANEGKGGDVTVFFGLSGTGKTTLSSDPARYLIGDDEHVWTNTGIFNIEGGCYAKSINLSPEQEPEIYEACKFGAILENVGYDVISREVDFSDVSLTQNTRLCYPLHHIASSKNPAVGGHPKNIIMLTCDAFGVLPPISKLTPEQAMYHFMSGYTAKVAGTEEGVKEPEATFSSCFGAPFLVWHPTKYAELLAEKMQQFKTDCWLINTGWSGGAFGEGKRMSLKTTRALIDAVHNGELAKAQYENMPVFNLKVPLKVTGVDSKVLMPSKSWADQAKYNKSVEKLANLFINNFKTYEEKASAGIRSASPVLKK